MLFCVFEDVTHFFRSFSVSIEIFKSENERKKTKKKNLLKRMQSTFDEQSLLHQCIRPLERMHC